MALRTLVFSSDERAAQILVQHLAEFDLEAVVCPNIFSALENAGRVRFDGIIADWHDDPEATFLVKRTKEIELNRKAMVLAIVRDDADVARAYDAGAKAVLLRPLDGGEIREALTKARPFMLERSASEHGNGQTSAPEPQSPLSRQDDVMPIASPVAQVFAGTLRPAAPTFDQYNAEPSELPLAGGLRHSRVPRLAVVGILVIVAITFAFRHARSIGPLGGKVSHVFQNIAATVRGSGDRTPPPALDDSLNSAGVASSPSGHVQVITSVSILYDAVARLPLRHETLPDFPLMAEKPDIPAPRPRVRAYIPESIMRSAPIESAHPVEAHLTPVMVDVVEPVSIPEESARQLLMDAVQPLYPQEALRSGIHGTVVLQALIGRDGTVRELRLIDGYFVLARAAVQAVKQWHFRPYMVNGRALEAETILTIDFRLPVVSGVPQAGETQ